MIALTAQHNIYKCFNIQTQRAMLTSSVQFTLQSDNVSQNIRSWPALIRVRNTPRKRKTTKGTLLRGLKNNLSNNRPQKLNAETVSVDHHLITVVRRLHFSPFLLLLLPLLLLLLHRPDAVEDTGLVRFKAVAAFERADVTAVAPVDLESSDTRACRKNVPLKLQTQM